MDQYLMILCYLLQEVIKLTEDLCRAQKEANPEPDPSTSSFPERKWVVGDKCCAQWVRDKWLVFPCLHHCALCHVFLLFSWYRATIEGMLVDGTCTVAFTDYDHTEAVPVNLNTLFHWLLNFLKENNHRLAFV
jgi:hypothetical protein